MDWLEELRRRLAAQGLLDGQAPQQGQQPQGLLGVADKAMAAGGKALVDVATPPVQAAWPYVEAGVNAVSPYVKRAYDFSTSWIPNEATLPGMINGALDADRQAREQAAKKKR